MTIINHIRPAMRACAESMWPSKYVWSTGMDKNVLLVRLVARVNDLRHTEASFSLIPFTYKSLRHLHQLVWLPALSQ